MTVGGSASYILRYRMGGREAPTRKVTIGRHGSPWTPDLAAREAERLLLEIRRGNDPVAARAKERDAAEEAGALDFDRFADRFIERHVVGNTLRSRADIEAVFRRDLRPAFAGRRVDELRKADIKEALAKIGERSQSAANKAHKWLALMCSWGVNHDRLEHSPMAGLRKPFRERRRKRVLVVAELVSVLRVLDGLVYQFAGLLLLLILTGQRLREVAGIRWSELDLDKAEWVIPEERTKKNRAHLVPLSRQVVRILRQLKERGTEECDLVLTTTGTTPISGFSKAKSRLDQLIRERLGALLSAWVVHDLRRSFATGCQGLKVPIAVTEAILNHESGTRSGLVGVYQLYTYAEEKREALQLWADHIEAALGHALSLPDLGTR